MAAVYRAQAARGDAEAIRGLELIEQGRWPGSGRRATRRGRDAAADHPADTIEA